MKTPWCTSPKLLQEPYIKLAFCICHFYQTAPTMIWTLSPQTQREVHQKEYTESQLLHHTYKSSFNTPIYQFAFTICHSLIITWSRQMSPGRWQDKQNKLDWLPLQTQRLVSTIWTKLGKLILTSWPGGSINLYPLTGVGPTWEAQ